MAAAGFPHGPAINGHRYAPSGQSALTKVAKSANAGRK
jgi:hypothetical protein